MAERIGRLLGAFVASVFLSLFLFTPLAALLGGVSGIITLGWFLNLDGLWGLSNFQLGALVGFFGSVVGSSLIEYGDSE